MKVLRLLSAAPLQKAPRPSNCEGKLRAALFYFTAVFAAGFVLGSVRILWLVPRVGVRAAELFEMPLMIVVTVLAARWTVRRFNVPFVLSARLGIGVLALSFLIAVELGVAVWLRDMSFSEYFTGRDPISGAAYFFALGLFAFMPMLVLRKRTGAADAGLIDRFISRPDVAESHEIIIHAPAAVVFDIAEHFDLQSIPLVRSIFRLRERVFRVRPAPRNGPKGIVAETSALGWAMLAYRPDRELVMGSVTQPWVGDVKFRPIPASEFSNFAEPGFVKIAWTLEVEPHGPRLTRFRTQTRVVATDKIAGRKFRLYWMFAGAFIVMIRVLINRAIRREAEQRAGTKDSLAS